MPELQELPGYWPTLFDLRCGSRQSPPAPLQVLDALDWLGERLAEPEAIERSLWRLCDRARTRALWPQLVHTLALADCFVWDSPLYQRAIAGTTALDAPPARRDFCDRFTNQFWTWSIPPYLESPEALQLLELERPAELVGWLLNPVRFVPDDLACRLDRPLTEADYIGSIGLSATAVLMEPVIPREIAPGDPRLILRCGSGAAVPIVRALPALMEGDPFGPYAEFWAADACLQDAAALAEPIALPRAWRRRRARQGRPLRRLYAVRPRVPAPGALA